METKLNIKGKCTFTFQDIKTGKIEKFVVENLVVDSGLSTLLSSINNLTHIALGLDDTAVAGSQTGLIEEFARASISSSNNNIVGNKLFISAYFPHDKGNGIIKEAGTIIGGTNVENSGTLFSRISAENSKLPKEKTDQKTLTVDWEIGLFNG